MDRPARRYVPVLGFAGLLLVASVLPVPESGGGALPTLFGIALDKWVHAGGYGLLTVLLARARRPAGATGVAVAAGLATAYGGAIELLQWPLATRGASGLDALANAAGAGLAALAWLVARRWQSLASEQ